MSAAGMHRARLPALGWRLVAHAAVYTVAASMLLPFAWMIITSVKADDEAMKPGSLWPQAWHWENYARAIRAANLDRYYGNSFIVAALTTILAGFYNALAGYAFSKMRFRGEKLAFSLTLATMMLPAQCFFIFAYVFAARLGFVDRVQALVIPFLASGFGIFFMRQAIAAVPDSLLEAGRMDGMSEFELFWLIVRPTVWPSIAALAIFSFVNSWNSFFWPLIVVDSDPMKTMPLAIAELSSGQYVQSWPVRMAAAAILTLPLVLVFILFQRSFVKGLAASGLKDA